MSYLYKEGKRILLIDADTRKRNLRTAVFRNHEFEVHTAASLTELAPFRRTISYDLVLLADPSHPDSAGWITQIRQHKPGQRIGLLVGPPNFIREVSRLAARTKLVQARPTVATEAMLDDSAASQWQTIIYALVRDWCTTKTAAFNLGESIPGVRQKTA